jgi:cbb3-type cytochrome oxidase subunit 1
MRRWILNLEDLKNMKDYRRHEKGKAVKLWFLLSVLWFAVFTTFGLLLAIKILFPDIPGDTSWLTFAF